MNDVTMNDVAKESELIPILNELAEMKGLKVFVFNNEEISKYYAPKNEILGVAMMAKNKDNALVNLKRLNKCYLIRLGE